MLLECWYHGKAILPQTDPRGLKVRERFFDANTPSVGPEECAACHDPVCPYGFNLKPLLKNPGLRQRVLQSIYDASLDDALLVEGLAPIRTYKVMERKRGPVFSKTTFDLKTGKELARLEEKFMRLWREGNKAFQRFDHTRGKAQHLPPRVILKRRKEPDENIAH